MTPIGADWRQWLVEACALPGVPGDRPEADARRGQAADTADLRQAAVLIGVRAGPVPAIYFTERSRRLTHHPGQISFPGGRIEASDDGPEAAALREAREEIGLDPRHVRVLGRIERYRTVTGFSIVPVVGAIDAGARCRADQAEVSRLFHVPLAIALDADYYRYRCIERLGQRYRIYSLDHEGDHIWGATAAILATLAHRVARVRGQDFVIDRPANDTDADVR